MRNIFGTPKSTPSNVQQNQIMLEEQKKTSSETLDYVREVLKRKDELLAEAVNQTGSAVRLRKRGARH